MSESSSSLREQSQVVASSPNVAGLEVFRAILLEFGIRAVVLAPDPLNFGMSVGMVLVLSADHARAARVLQEAQVRPAAEDWSCPECDEPVPGHFDLCWNCLALKDGDRPPQATATADSARLAEPT